MKRKITTLIMVLCFLFNLSAVPVLGEETLQDYEKYGTMNTEVLTEDNVIFNAMKADKEMSLFSNNEVNIYSDFDVVLGFDMSSSMYDFDYNGDKEWIEAFQLLSEQVPEGTRFSVVTEQAGKLNENLDLMIETLPDVYNGNTDIKTLLENCANTFDDESNEKNKVIIAATAENIDSTELEGEVDKLRSKGIIPFVFVLNDAADESDTENTYVCANELELRIGMSDLYLALAEFKTATSPNAVINTTDYKKDRHDFSGCDTNIGVMLASVLNMYKCVPLKASAGGSSYDLFNLHQAQVLKSFLEADNASCGTMQNDFVNTWNNIFQQVINANDTSVVTVNNIQDAADIVIKNMKRRFPILVNTANGWKLASSYSSNSNNAEDITIYDSDGNSLSLEDVDKIFDINQYVIRTSIEGANIGEEVSMDSGAIYVDLSYPTGYDIVIDTQNDENSNIRKEALDETSGGIDFVVRGENELRIESSIERNFVVGSLVQFDGGYPNIYNANKIYFTRMYNDVMSTHEWYYSYLFRATNIGMVEGDDHGAFNQGNNVKKCEFLKMLLEAMNVDVPDAEQPTEPDESPYWAYKYIRCAKEIGILDDVGNSLDMADNDTVLEYGETAMTRGNAAEIICKLVFSHFDEVQTPTILYHYESGLNANTKYEDWTEITDIKNSSYYDYMYQLFMNGILEGYGDKTIGPDKYLTRAEVCKVIVSCLFNMDEQIPVILADIDSGITPVTITMDSERKSVDDIIFQTDETAIFNIILEDNEEYMLETTGDLSNDTIIKSSFERVQGSSGTIQHLRGNVIEGGTTETKTHALYTFSGAGTYTFTVNRSGSSHVGLNIQSTAYGQRLYFNSKEGEYYIFDDNPEYIRRCDILDDGEYEPSAVMHADNLGKAKYNVFSYHHVALVGVGDGYSPEELFFPQGTQLMFDAVFSNSDGGGGTIKITRIGFETSYDLDWDCNVIAYQNYNNLLEVPIERYIGSDPLYLSDLVGNKIINNINNLGDFGVVHLLLEFEVIDGAVDFATVAYKDKDAAKNIINNQKIKSKYDQTVTLKGIAEDSKTKTANQLTYIVDENDSTLYFNIENQFYNEKLSDCFETNCNPWSQIDNFSGSSMVNFWFDGQIVVRNSDGTSTESEDKRWYLDSVHSRYPYEHFIPETARYGVYSGKSMFDPNEKLDEEWMLSIPNNENKTILSKEFNVHYKRDEDPNPPMTDPGYITTTGIEFGITHEVPVRIFNNSNQDLLFTYTVEGQCFDLRGSASWENGGKYDFASKESEYEDRIQTFESNLPSKEWTTIVVKTTLLTSGSGEMRHDFKISSYE